LKLDATLGEQWHFPKIHGNKSTENLTNQSLLGLFGGSKKFPASGGGGDEHPMLNKIVQKFTN